MYKAVLLCLYLLSVVYADTRTALPGKVLWSNPESWVPSGIPSAGDTVVILNGTDVVFDSQTPV